MDDFKDFVVFIVAIIVAVSLLLGFVGSVLSLLELPACNSLAVGSDYEYRWEFWTGCKVNVDGIWISPGHVSYNAVQGRLELDD